MPSNLSRLRILALLLGIVFLAAQFHFCADLTSDSASSSHMCPFCAAAGSAMVAQSPNVAIVPPVMNRLESPAVVFLISAAIPRATSPRAPPSL
jgi:hypothetical protein